MSEEYKGFKLMSDGTFSLTLIKPIGKGSVPKELRGSYTNKTMARKAIDLVERGKSNGKATASRRN